MTVAMIPLHTTERLTVGHLKFMPMFLINNPLTVGCPLTEPAIPMIMRDSVLNTLTPLRVRTNVHHVPGAFGTPTKSFEGISGTESGESRCRTQALSVPIVLCIRAAQK